jgi:hypothetical protein
MESMPSIGPSTATTSDSRMRLLSGAPESAAKAVGIPTPSTATISSTELRLAISRENR